MHRLTTRSSEQRLAVGSVPWLRPLAPASVAELGGVGRHYAPSMNDDSALDLWWAVPGVLAGMSGPFLHPEQPHTPDAARDAFADELPALWQAGVRAVVCLLNMPGAASTYAAAEFAFLLLPIADGAAPSSEQFERFLAFVSTQRILGQAVAVHCEAGIGRTGTLLAGYLIASGFAPDAAIARVRSLRPGAIKTAQQVRFLGRLSATSTVPPNNALQRTEAGGTSVSSS